MADVELSEQEIELQMKELRAAAERARARREAEEARAEALKKAQAKLGSDALYQGVADKMRALQRDLKDLQNAASPAGKKAAQEISDALGRAGGLLVSGSAALKLTDAERALLPKPAPVAKKAAPRGK